MTMSYAEIFTGEIGKEIAVIIKRVGSGDTKFTTGGTLENVIEDKDKTTLVFKEMGGVSRGIPIDGVPFGYDGEKCVVSRVQAAYGKEASLYP